jgi:short-subunit dehydrogenase
VPLEEARRQFDVNVFGLERLTQFVLPGMGENHYGKIVNISSMGGKIYTPFGGWYHATKHAVEGLTDCLRLETTGFGIDPVVIEPGGVATDWGVIAVVIVRSNDPGVVKLVTHPLWSRLASIIAADLSTRGPRRANLLAVVCG